MVKQQMEQHAEDHQSAVVRSLMAVYYKQREAARRRQAVKAAGGLDIHTLRDIMIDGPKGLSLGILPQKETGRGCC